MQAYACLLANGLDGTGEALRILVNEASRIERAQHSRPRLMSALPSAWTTPTATRTKLF